MFSPRARHAIYAAIVVFCFATPAPAQQRTLHWDSIDVTAHLDADGRLLVTETQTMVFTGDWNGGERRFDIRPRQQFAFLGMHRADGERWHPLTLDSDLDAIDEYAQPDDQSVRWRSRLPADPPFAATVRRYSLLFEFRNIVLRKGEELLLEHDFLFPDREGEVGQASVRLTFDPEWQPRTLVPESYTATNIAPGEGLVIRVPLRYSGAGVPLTLDTRVPREIVLALWTLFALPLFAVAWFFAREHWYGRFAPLPSGVDTAWIEQHLLTLPAEVVAAAWDDHIESAEVVALIARLVAEGTLASEVGKKTLTLRLLVDRETLSGHARALVDALFFNGRTTTSTALVREHYKAKGFNPADVVRAELREAMMALLPPGRVPWSVPLVATATTCVGSALILAELLNARIGGGLAALLITPPLLLALVARREALRFRAYTDWGYWRAFRTLLLTLPAPAAAATFLYAVAGPGIVEASPRLVAAIVLLALGVVFAVTRGMQSRQSREALAFRKRLTAARAFFIAELEKDRPALRDAWFPWVLAFGLGKQMDAWSVRRPSSQTPTSRGRSSRTSSTFHTSSGASSSVSSSSTWSGFAGGRAGGGGGGAAWTAAAAGMAAPVSTPSSRSSGSSGSGGGSSSSGGSSGGGGGGGW